MVTLLLLIWRDEAGPATASAQSRRMMGSQVTRQRLALGFPLGVQVAAKSGSLLGIIRNEVGVVTMPDSRRYAAGHLAGSLGYAAVAIDAPHHGERTPVGEKGLSPLERRERMGLAAWRERNSRATAQAVADWQAAIDAVQGLDAVPDVPVAYIGVSMGTRFGIPLTAAEPRITAAVFGLFGHPVGDSEAAFARAARQVTIPVLFPLAMGRRTVPQGRRARAFRPARLPVQDPARQPWRPPPAPARRGQPGGPLPAPAP